uniref:Putative glycosyltransferase n=1 Tax=viral metagenome TaxID=1070528 RepID=A0A6M3MFU5_9ZZZZ
MNITVISRWYNEEFLAPFFLNHYSFADEILIMLDNTTTDRSAEIISRYPNARFEYFYHGGVIDDGLMAIMMSDLVAGLKSDWVIYVDADEFVFSFDYSDGIKLADPREILNQANGNLINVWFWWVYRHKTDIDLDPSKPAIYQRRHGGEYTLSGQQNDRFVKPCIVKPETRIRWTPGTHGYEKSNKIQISNTLFNGVHWQLVDVENAVDRMINGREKRLSTNNLKHGWGVRNLTEEMIRTECIKHLTDPKIF